MIEMIVNSNGKEGDKTARIEFPINKQILDVFYNIIINYIDIIIKLKRAIKRIRIDDNP